MWGSAIAIVPDAPSRCTRVRSEVGAACIRKTRREKGAGRSATFQPVLRTSHGVVDVVGIDQIPATLQTT